MIKDVFPAFSYWWVKNASMFHSGAFIALFCYGILSMKLLRSKNGAFRFFLLGYFGASAITSYALSYWHPYYNYWLIPTAHLPKLLGLIALTGYVLFEFWFSKDNRS